MALYRIFLSLLAVMLSGCISIPRDFSAPTPENYDKAVLTGFNNIRFWGDEVPPQLSKLIKQRRQRVANSPLRRRLDILALSGGGEDGAFGAGFLKGWTQRANRPEFSIVTGISTGALIAPFAFLGSAYDEHIRQFYTESSGKDIYILKPFKALFGGAALGDTLPLRSMIRREINQSVVNAIARESRRGRSLFIGTTNLDAQRPMIWDIGQIAESGHPDAAWLIGNIMLASAAIPGVFPPVRFDVVIDGQRHQELHVDGGVTNQIFVYPIVIKFNEWASVPTRLTTKNFWLLRNTKITPSYEEVRLNVLSVASRAINTLIKYQGRSNLALLEQLAQRDGFNLHLAYVPDSFDTPMNELFDQTYMRDLYQLGYRTALSERPWSKSVANMQKTLPGQ